VWSIGTPKEPKESRTILCPPPAAEPSCPANQTDDVSQLGRLHAASLTSAFVLAQLWKLTWSITLSQSPGYQAPQNNGWLHRTMVTTGVGGRTSGRVAGCFIREVPLRFLVSNSDGLTLNGTGNQPQMGCGCHLWKIPVNIHSDVFFILLPVPEGLILIQFFNPLHLLHPLSSSSFAAWGRSKYLGVFCLSAIAPFLSTI